MFHWAELSATAAGNWVGSATSGNVICQAGQPSVVARPSEKVRANMSGGLRAPKTAVIVKANMVATAQPCDTTRMALRGHRSEMAPAGTASATMARLPAVCTNETSSGDLVRSAMRHMTVTPSTQDPSDEASAAAHRILKRRPLRGSQAERDGAALVGWPAVLGTTAPRAERCRLAGRRSALFITDHIMQGSDEGAHREAAAWMRGYLGKAAPSTPLDLYLGGPS